MIDKVFDHFPYFSKVQILPHEAKSERLKNRSKIPFTCIQSSLTQKLNIRKIGKKPTGQKVVQNQRGSGFITKTVCTSVGSTNVKLLC